MKLNMILVGGSILAMFGAVGTLETTTDVLAPMLVIGIAFVAGTVGAMRMRGE